MERRGDNLEQASVQLFHKIVSPATKSESATVWARGGIRCKALSCSAGDSAADWGLVCASSMAVDLAQFALGIIG